IKILSIDNVIPTVENVKNKSYSISRAVYWYVDEEMSETTKQLVEYMLSDKGQKIVLDEGFVSIK
ncbi:MAG: phosphate ABC transporter substrate-binding protein, partial [Fusobacteriaceae bacterium]|nr:phosphate ABC transporter substrate-binding protein [Fusobacteriaceae bacterium]